MSEDPAIGNHILRFSGTASGDQIPYDRIIDDVAKRTVEIHKYNLNGVFGKSFNIPDYQRGYQWSEEEWNELWEELEQLFEADADSVSREVSDVFFGSMFLSRLDDTGDGGEIYEVIDGQQRLTTLSIVFYLISNKIRECISQDETHTLFDELGEEPGNISSIVYRSAGAGAANEPALKLDRRNRELFEALLGEDDDKLEFLVTREVKHPKSQDNVIKVRNYLEDLGLDEAQYFTALNDPDYYNSIDDDSRRPNLWQYEQDELGNENTAGEDLNAEVRQSILDNKVRIQETNLKLIAAYETFDRKIENQLEEFDSYKQRGYALTNLKNFILNSFHIGYFEVKEEHPRLLMKIFEILNDRGVELKKTDVIRTRIVGRFRDEPDGPEYIEKWEQVIDEFGNAERVNEFLRTFFVVDGQVTSRGQTKNRLLEAFSTVEDDSHKLRARLGELSDAKGLLDDLVTYASYYHDLIDPENRGIDLGNDGDEEIEQECNRILTRLNNANTSIWQPLVLGVYHDVREESIGDQAFLRDLLEDIEALAVRSFAALDTNVRDSAYSDAMEVFHELDSLNDAIRNELKDIETDDPQAFGEDLVVSLYQADWRRAWGKQVLRKISSEGFETEDAVVLQELNTDNKLVHLEHVFPQSPFLNDEQKYEWFKNFFKTGGSHLGFSTEVNSEIDLTIQDVVKGLVHFEEDDLLEQIASEYQDDLGNLALLRYRENIQIENQLFGQKLAKYQISQGFCELRCNHYICEEIMGSSGLEDVDLLVKVTKDLDSLSERSWEELQGEYDFDAESFEEFSIALEERQLELNDAVSSVHPRWNFETVSENRAELVEILCESIAFSDDEFDHVDFEELSEEETDRRNSVISRNNERQVR